jgi:hypothetical protein
MNIQEFITVTNFATDEKKSHIFRPSIFCKDGFNFSCQAGNGLYSTPRERAAKYTSMEVGYPSAKEDLFIEFADNKDEPTDTIYPYIPIEVIQATIEKHGGIDINKTFTQPKN